MDFTNNLPTRQTRDGLIVTLPAKAPDENNSVVVVTVSGPLDVAAVSPMLRKDGSLELTPEFAFLHNNEGARAIKIQYAEGGANIGSWTDAHAWVEWPLKIDRTGRYEVIAELAVEGTTTRFRIGLPDNPQTAEVAATGGFQSYAKKTLGLITIEQAGSLSLRINPDTTHWQPVNLRRVILRQK